MSDKKKLFTFNFVGGGFNQVFALSKDDVVEESRSHLGAWADKIDPKTIRVVENEQAYWDNMPLMD